MQHSRQRLRARTKSTSYTTSAVDFRGIPYRHFATAAARQVLADHYDNDGVRLGAATWIVTAQRAD